MASALLLSIVGALLYRIAVVNGGDASPAGMVQQMIDAEKWSSLLAADQLQQELKAHRVRSSQCTLCHPSG